MSDDVTTATDGDTPHAEQADDVDASEVDAVEPDPEPEPDPNAVPIELNGRSVDARKGELVIAAAERHGAYIPHFCYHPRMKSVGMCRQCLVEVDTGRGPQLQPSCMITVSPDMKVDTESDTTKRAQEGILELLLANHPLDCPVCDKGGECPLQDQAFSHGPGESRYVEEKRHYEKPIPISDLVLLDRERCILCDRCTRFADEVAGDKLIHFVERGNQTQVMTFPDEPFASYFSGNTVQICPVGALTAEPYRFKARPWDLQTEESTCTTCSVGCRVVVHTSRDEVLRYNGVDSEPVNHGWMCDRGRFDFQSVNSEHRLGEPMVATEGGQVTTTWNVAMTATADLVRQALDAGGADSIALIGGARGTNEDAFAWAQLADGLGVSYRDAQLGDGLPASVLGVPRATIADAASADTVILLGPDLKEELPVLYLRLRDAAENGSTSLVEVSPNDTGLTRYAAHSVRHQPGLQADAVGRFLDDHPDLASGDVVVVAGRGNLAESADATVAALNTVLDRIPSATVLPALRRGNVVGALSLGLAPADADHDATAALTAASEGRVELLILLGADPLNDHPDAGLARRALAGARRIVAVDTFPTESVKQADVVLPAASFAEKSGTTTNLEGRVTTVADKVTTTGTARPDWMIAAELALTLDVDTAIDDATAVDDVTRAIADTVDGFDGITPASLSEHPDGIIASSPAAALPVVEIHTSARNTYDHRLVVSRTLYDRAVGTAMSPSIAKLGPGAAVHLHPLDVDQLGASEGGDVRLIAADASAVLPVVADTSVSRGVVWVPFNQGGGHVEDLISHDADVVDVRVEVL